MYSKDLGGKCYWSFGTSRAKGVGIWFKENLNCEILLLNRDVHGRCLSVTVKINNVVMKMINVYAPVIAKERNISFLLYINFYLVATLPFWEETSIALQMFL